MGKIIPFKKKEPEKPVLHIVSIEFINLDEIEDDGPDKLFVAWIVFLIVMFIGLNILGL